MPGVSSVPVPTYLDLTAMEDAARLRIGEMAYAYYAGAAEEEVLLAGNVAAWRRWQLVPKVLVDVSDISSRTTFLGQPVASPVMVAPTALHAMADPDGEVATARGAAAAGACMVLSSLSNRSLEEVAAGAPDAPRWMQVYVLKDRDKTAEMVRRAAAGGYRALAVTVDAPVGGLRLREIEGRVRLPDDLRLPNLAGVGEAEAHEGAGGFMAAVTREFDPALTFDDIGWLAACSGIPVVVKGVLRADDARRCVEAGAAAVVVSNHGARQLDDAPATAEILEEVVQAVGDLGEVYVDGGVRRPADVVKALALGARGVLLGRPVLWALAVGGGDGVCELLRWFDAELRRVMALCGTPAVADIERSLVRRGP